MSVEHYCHHIIYNFGSYHEVQTKFVWVGCMLDRSSLVFHIICCMQSEGVDDLHEFGLGAVVHNSTHFHKIRNSE